MKRQFVVVAALIAVTTASIFADTLVLTNGRRVPGELVGVQRREIEFEERGSRRILRIPRDEISRVEFEDDRSFERDDFSGGGGIPRAVIEQRGNRDVERDANDAHAGAGLHHQRLGQRALMLKRIQ